MEAYIGNKNKILEIAQPYYFRSYFELKDADELIGILSYPQSSKFFAVAELNNETWEFKRDTLWKNNEGIYESDKELSLAKYNYNRFFKKILLSCRSARH